MILALPIILYTLFLLPYLTLIPYSDGSTEFRVAYNFYNGHYLTNWIPYHPPLKPFIASIFFSLFGPGQYTIIGLLLGILGIASMYYLALKLYDKKTALLSSFFLALSGLYVSTSLFSLNDFIMTVFILLAFALYVRQKYLWYAIAVTLAVCAKETAILFPVAVASVEIYHKKFRKEQLLPVIALIVWIIFLYSSGHTLWNSWNFSDKQSMGIQATIFHNIVSLSFINRFAFANWLHLFFFNYNWVYWILAIIAFRKIKKTDNIFIMVIFIFLYSLLVLTIQTYAITRYILPLLPFVYILAAQYLVRSRFAVFLITIILFLSISSLFTSDDPVSNRIWQKTTLLDHNFYYSALAGNDGITYNMEYFNLVHDRDKILLKGNFSQSKDPMHIDPETIKAYHLKK
jgi:4-amino-4-deoxy-L-arabinose transferase-like glycosyltransferase